METYKKFLSKMKSSKNNKKNTVTKKNFVLENSNFKPLNGTNLNPFKIISVAWRKSERLDNLIRKALC